MKGKRIIVLGLCALAVVAVFADEPKKPAYQIADNTFFDMSADDAFNYGAIGVVIGHEMTHGFDDQGCQFDKDGNMVNWWTAEDKAAFDKRTKVMEEAFNMIEVAPGVHANGAFTLGENIADHGGLQVSFLAFTLNEEAKPEKERLTTRDGFTPQQRFFLAYANVWAGNIRPEEILNRTKSDPHSLGRWRVNGALPQIGAVLFLHVGCGFGRAR